MRKHLIILLRILDALKDGASEKEIADVLFDGDVSKTKTMIETAKYMSEKGYKDLIRFEK